MLLTGSNTCDCGMGKLLVGSLPAGHTCSGLQVTLLEPYLQQTSIQQQADTTVLAAVSQESCQVQNGQVT